MESFATRKLLIDETNELNKTQKWERVPAVMKCPVTTVAVWMLQQEYGRVRKTYNGRGGHARHC